MTAEEHPTQVLSDPQIVLKTMFLKENGPSHMMDKCKAVGIDAKMSVLTP